MTKQTPTVLTKNLFILITAAGEEEGYKPFTVTVEWNGIIKGSAEEFISYIRQYPRMSKLI